MPLACEVPANGLALNTEPYRSQTHSSSSSTRTDDANRECRRRMTDGRRDSHTHRAITWNTAHIHTVHTTPISVCVRAVAAARQGVVRRIVRSATFCMICQPI